jgi:acetylglutamate kinase
MKKNGIIVVKVGGSTWDSRDAALDDLVSLQREGCQLVVVHGGGDLVSRWLEIHGIESKFVGGLRVTDGETLPVVVAVLAGLVNKDLVAGINAQGGRAVGLSGADGGLIRARRRPEMGFVGDVEGINTDLLRSLLEDGYMPVVAPVGINSGGEALPSQLLNINADTVAGEIAVALGADCLVFLTDVPGVVDAQGQVIGRLSAQEAKALTKAGTIARGMLPKVEACLRAASSSTTALIVDGRWAHTLRDALNGRIAGTSVG